MKNKRDCDSDLIKIAIIMPIIIAAAIWFSEQGNNEQQQEKIEDLLQKKLNKAVEVEDYELAAKLRDKIKRLRS
jgi:excinuclease UvrABC helicase subunit UvrB